KFRAVVIKGIGPSVPLLRHDGQKQSIRLSHRRILLMSLKLTIVIATGLLVSSCTLLAADSQKPAAKSEGAAVKTAEKDAAEDKGPRLTIVEPVKDFGTVAKGEKLDWAFQIKNTGTTDLQIISAKPGCGCTVADFDKVIK